MKDLPKYRFLLRAILRYRTRVVGALVCSLFVSLFSVGSIVMFKPVLDLLFGRVDELPPMTYELGTDALDMVIGLPGIEPDQADIALDGQRLRITAPLKESEDWLSKVYLPEKNQLEKQIRLEEQSRYADGKGFFSGEYKDKLRELFAPLYTRLAGYIRENRLLVLAGVAGLALLLTVLKAGFTFAQLYLTHWIGRRVIMDIRKTVFDHIMAMDMGFFSRQHSGNLLSYLTIDVEVLGSSLFAILGQALLEPVTIIVTLAVLLHFYPLLTAFYLFLIPVMILIVAILGRRIRKARTLTQNALGAMNTLLQETFSGMPVVKTFGMDEERERKFKSENRQVFRTHMRIVKARGVSNTLTDLLAAIGVAAILMVGGLFVFRRGMDATSFLVYIFWLVSLYHPFKRLNKAYNSIQQGMAAMDRVFSILESDTDVKDSGNARPLSTLEGDVCFENVSFTYDEKTFALKDVSISVPQGKIVALVGPSGAGKSTFVSLIPRFYDPSSGRVTMDGHDLREVTLRSLRDQIGLVPQETILFNDTVRANITCGNDLYTEDQIEKAARDAQAHDFIMALPEGYNSFIGERGSTLSGGQGQRIALARAILKNPPILIFDEATSALDSESELLIRKALDDLMKNRTVFVIAHRLSTVLHADMILVLDQGRVIDSGTHEELLKRCALYQRLYSIQFATHDESTLETTPQA